MSKTTKRLLILTPAALLILMIGAAAWFWYQMGEPLYRPGMVRSSENLRGPLTPPAQPEDASRWRVEQDIELHHSVYGSGTPVLFIHGGPGFPQRGLPAGLERLADENEIHLYDQRGCGRSTKPFDRFTSSNDYENLMALDATLGLGAHIADIERIRRILGHKRLTLIGHSFGGFLAALYAAEFPEHVRALVLVAPANLIVFPIEGGGLFESVRAKLPAEMKEEYESFLTRYLDFGTVFSKSEAELAAVHREFARFYAAAGGMGPAGATRPVAEDNGGWAVTAVYFSMGRRHDYRDALRAVTAPTLILHGERDLQPVSMSRRYTEWLPNARLELIEGAGHFIFDESPDRFAAAVGDFLQEIARAD